MYTDLQLAQLNADIYHGGETFDIYEAGGDDSGICYGIILRPDENIITFRGSKSLTDWIRDIIGMPAIFPHTTFGFIHAGFAIGMDRTANEISQHVNFSLPTTITGHSLGAARAAILTAMFLENYQRDHSKLKRVVFGEPLSGFQTLADYIKPVEARSYRNGSGWHHDLITDLPLYLPPTFNWTRASTLIHVSAPPTNFLEKSIDPFGYHHIPLYVQALTNGLQNPPIPQNPPPSLA